MLELQVDISTKIHGLVLMNKGSFIYTIPQTAPSLSCYTSCWALVGTRNSWVYPPRGIDLLIHFPVSRCSTTLSSVLGNWMWHRCWKLSAEHSWMGNIWSSTRTCLSHTYVLLTPSNWTMFVLTVVKHSFIQHWQI